MTPERTVRQAAKLYEARDTIRRLLGARYAEETAFLGNVLKRIEAHRGINTMEAACWTRRQERCRRNHADIRLSGRTAGAVIRSSSRTERC